MAQLSSSQRAWRGRIETGLRLVAPVLDLVLAAGDRVSRVVDRGGSDPVPSARLTADRRQRALADGQG